MALALAALGCSQSSPTAPEPGLLQELRAAPTSVMVAGKTLTLGTSLWRDFQPISPPDGKPLIALLQISTTDGSPVPASARADTVWVLYGAEVWTATPLEERLRTATSPIYEVIAREGPKWGPDVAVDVIVQLRDASGQAFRLRAANQVIRATM